jgi:hypothetical protein
MRSVVAWIFLTCLCAVAYGQPAAKIVGPTEAPAGELVVLSSTGSTGDNLKWVKPDGLQTLQVGCSLLDTQMVFATTKPGAYKFMLIVADKEARIDYIEHTVTIGGSVKPPPVDPEEPVNPPPVDPSPTKWTSLQNASKASADRMNDAGTRSKLKAAIAAVALDISGRCDAGQCPTVDAAKDQVRKAIEQTLLARTGSSALIDWTQWRKANQAELDRLGIVDCKDYLAAVRAISSGL